jgi:hypothetical protein
MTHICNPSYSGGRDQEDCSSKPPRQIVHGTLSQRKTFTEKRLMEWLKVKGLSLNPSTAQKKKKKKN